MTIESAVYVVMKNDFAYSLRALARMMKADFTREQVLSCGYTEDEYARVEEVTL